MELRPHQSEALAAIEEAVAAGEPRMTVVAACGSGKTLIAQQAARRLAPQGAVLVLMPTKALVTQTVRRWRAAGHPGLALVVCSLSQRESALEAHEAVITRHPPTISRALSRGGPVTVFATYGSLHHLEKAHAHHGLPAWDLAIVDEAHRTCSAFGDGWGSIHDDALFPAKTRIYMTATPRLWGAPDPAADTAPVLLMERVPLATMDHREVFGPTVYTLTLSEAIARGILADYQVILPIIDDSDADLHAILTDTRPHTSAHHNGLRNAAVQIALLRALAEHRLRRVLVFHNRVALADAFAHWLPRTARMTTDPLRIEDLWSASLHSRQSGDQRRAVLQDFETTDRDHAVLSNVRVLNEGVDMPAVDAVVFAAPRYSIIDAVQAIGRGLRQQPGQGKKTALIIPVYLRRGTDPAQLLEDSAFATLLNLLQALRAHDESFTDRIALPARTHSGPATDRRAEAYARPERAAQLARAIGLEITVPAIGTWAQALASATAYHAVFHHLDVPAPYIDPDGFALGECIRNLRLRHLLSRLPADHEQALNALGMLWTTPESTFEHMLQHARAYATEHGHLAPSVKTTTGGHRLGAWLSTQRRKANAGRLPAAHAQALAATDPYWNPPSLAWRRTYARVEAHLADLPPHKDRTPEQQELETWLYNQRLRFFRLAEQQQEMLLALKIPPLPRSLYYGSLQEPERHAFYDALGHAAAFLAREGHLDVPPDHHEPHWSLRESLSPPAPFALGKWLSRRRARPQMLTDEQRRALEALQALAQRQRPQPGPSA
ncbi:Helicase associated domain protein [Streptomyces olivaceus]|uniref:DEAD/DEAH box helicase n=1 Tax=Streptomyces olivaceus TaxID=47716 RepID=UPI0036268860